MEYKTIICIDCGCEVKVKKMDGRTKRCKEHQDKFRKEYQNNYQKDYFQLYRRKTAKESGRQRIYKRRYINSEEDIEYCKNNWYKVKGCLECKCEECIQPTDNDSYLPWENEGFYKDDEKIDYVVERSIG